MKEIFDLQWKLNAYTLKNIGVNYETVTTDPREKPVWLENYRKAFSAELAELVREVEEYGMKTKNGKIEIVDMLHFLVSLSHVVGVEPGEVAIGEGNGAPSFTSCTMQAFLALDELQNSVKWKWWAKGGGYKPDKARHATLYLWRCFDDMCGLFEMDFETIKSIYIAKNEVNFRRQDQSYNEDTKTETDNQALEI